MYPLLLYGSVSLLVSLAVWKLLPMTLFTALAGIGASAMFLLLLLNLRFMPQMTVAVWTNLWGIFTPLFAGSLFAMPYLPPIAVLGLVAIFTFGIGLWASYRFYPFVSDKRLHKSRFARLDEVEPLLSPTPLTDTLVLGSYKQFLFFRQYLCIRPNKDHREIGHCLIIAPTGMGKTTMIKCQSAQLTHTSVIYTDPKGELYRETAGDRARLGPVYVLDPINGVGNCYDPLHGATTEEDYADIAQMLTFAPHTSDPFWTENAAKKIACLFQAARKENIPPFPYLRSISRLGLTRVAERLHSIDPALATMFLEEDYNEASRLSDDRTLKSVWSTLTTAINSVTTENIVRCFSRSDFTAETIMRSDRPVTVYLRLPEERLKMLAPFVRLVIASLGKDMITTWNRVQGQGCRKVFIFHDEAGIFALPNLDEFVSTARSKGITYNGYFQSTGQLDDTYGKEKARTIRQCMYNSVFLKPNDTEDSQRIEAKLGRGSRFAESKHLREGSEYSEGLSEQGIPVMAARELEEMDEKYAIVFHGNYKPMKVHRLQLAHHTLFTSRQGLPPPVVPDLPTLAPLPEVAAHEQPFDPPEFINPDEIFTKQKEKKTRPEQEISARRQRGEFEL